MTDTKRVPSKRNFLNFFKTHGSYINTIIDIGVQYETPELKEVFPDKFHILIEPVNIYQKYIKNNYKDISHILIQKAVGDSNKIGYLNEFNIYDDGDTTTHSHITNDETKRKIEIINLDEIINLNNFKSPCLLKIDTDGNEIDILKSCNKIYNFCDIIIVEAWVNRIGIFCNILQNKNYRLYDIIDLCYIKNVLSQVDLVFIKTSIYEDVSKYSELNPVKYYNDRLKKNIWNYPEYYYNF